MKKILRNHTGYKQWDGFYHQYGNQIFFEYMTEVGEEEILITTVAKISTKSKKGKKILSDMIEKQSSPIKKFLQDFERENKRDLKEGKGCELYSLPDDILKLIDKENSPE